MRTTQICFVAAVLATAPAFAQDQAPDKPQNQATPAVPAVAATPIAVSGSADFSLRSTNVKGDAARFQRFRDGSSGGYIDGFRLSTEGANWLFRGNADHAGRLDQRYEAEYRRAGKFRALFTWDQIPLFFSNDTRTLYTQESRGVFRLDDRLQQDIQAGKLTVPGVVDRAQPVEVRSRRDTANFLLVYSPSRDLDVKFNVKSARRDGSMPLATSFAFSDAVELPAPIDTRTTDVNGGLEWANQRGSLRVGYDGSWFTNHVQSLVWDNPLKIDDSNNARGYAVGDGGSQGRYALWPSSNVQSVTTAGALKVGGTTRVTANVSVGSMSQNQPLLPFTINTSVTGLELERPTTEGKVRTLAMNYTATSRPNRYLWLNARYRYYDFDNRTPMFEFPQYVVMDQTVHEGDETHIHSFTRQNLDLDASVTPLPFTSVRVGYSRGQDDRTHRIFETTTDNVFRTSLDTVSKNGIVTLRGIYERSKRTGSGFEQDELEELGEQPDLRHYDIADRVRDRVTALAQLTPIPALGFSASIAAGKDDYLHSGFGLRNNKNRAYTVTADFAASNQVAGGIAYSYERYTALQWSRSASPGVQFGDPRRNWSIDTGDKARNFNASLDLPKVISRTDVRLAYNINRSRTTYVYGLVADTTLTRPEQLPPITNELQIGTADVQYFLTPKAALGLLYWYDRYRVQDFSLGQTPLAPAGSLFLGYLYQPYTANSVAVRLVYLW